MADLPLAQLIDAEALRSRVAELGKSIAGDYRGRVPVLVGVLSGALPFLADLVRAIDIDLEVDFLALSRFGEGGRVRIAMDTEIPLSGRHVIIVEDIVDTGLTLTVMRRLLAAREVATLATVALLDKVERRIVEVPLEYRGFQVGDEYLLGYGLDHDGIFRNLPSIWAVLDVGALGDQARALANSVLRAR
ncbi:MAG: hypoxanthine phosphoribosyltransferase [Acidimicrobiia bacterium]